jgi:hypothetical protein
MWSLSWQSFYFYIGWIDSLFLIGVLVDRNLESTSQEAHQPIYIYNLTPPRSGYTSTLFFVSYSSSISLQLNYFSLLYPHASHTRITSTITVDPRRLINTQNSTMEATIVPWEL